MDIIKEFFYMDKIGNLNFKDDIGYIGFHSNFFINDEQWEKNGRQKGYFTDKTIQIKEKNYKYRIFTNPSGNYKLEEIYNDMSYVDKKDKTFINPHIHAFIILNVYGLKKKILRIIHYM